MAWIDKGDVATLLQTSLADDPWIDDLIAQVQGLAEIEIGEQDPPSAGVKAVLAQITARMWRAGREAQANPAALDQSVTGPFTFAASHSGAGLGLTDREIKALKKAAGQLSVWTLGTTRGPRLETPPIHDDDLGADDLDAVEQALAAASQVRQR